MKRRDAQDEGRAVAPLKPADDAVMLDSSTMTIDAVVERILSRVR